MKHTPGPWKYELIKDGTGAAICISSTNWADDSTEELLWIWSSIGHYCKHEEFKCVKVGGQFECDHTDQVRMSEATARLISATPDLLSIAKLIVKEWEKPTTGVQKGELIARLSQYALEARKAIDKAEGRDK